MNKELIQDFFIGVFHHIISPVYVPLGLCWEHRGEIVDFYIQCFRAITFKEI